MTDFFQCSQYFVNIHLNLLVIRFFSLPEQKGRHPKSDIGCCKSEFITCKEANINEKKEKNHCRKSAGCYRKQCTYVHTLKQIHITEYSYIYSIICGFHAILNDIFKIFPHCL